ncbi:MAG: acyl-CoA dehydrogenase family protein [Vulcanimicrobiaceae bacterium]
MDLQAGPFAGGTHEVLNQPPPLCDYNVFESDTALQAAVVREGGATAVPGLREIGAAAGSQEAIALGYQANQNPPVLHTHDRYGHRVDEVAFHPSWHQLLTRATGYGLHGAAWHDARAGAHVARAAAFFIWNQVEAGHGCPVSMTYAAIPALRNSAALAALWEPRFTTKAYDPTLRPIAQKKSALCGMAMTEKQGGSDVRANTTRAQRVGNDTLGDRFEITGHKWFCSAPMSDAFLVLAQSAAGLSCFFLPRILEDGTKNAFAIQRLKDKLGNRSNASSEVEFQRAVAWLVGEEGRGVQTIIEMVNSTRLDCVNGSAALMRQALVQALHHTSHRRAFGERLIDQPAMQNVLADLALESEAATVLLMRLARAADLAIQSEHDAQIKRLGTAMAKFWVCKRTPWVVGEALECLGGNGYVEESMMPRLYREAPLNSIWEGSGNVNALDVLRAIGKSPDILDAFIRELEPVVHQPAVAKAIVTVRCNLGDGLSAQSTARQTVETLAVLIQYALLARSAPNEVADAFYASRIEKRGGYSFGTLPAACAFSTIIARAASF